MKIFGSSRFVPSSSGMSRWVSGLAINRRTSPARIDTSSWITVGKRSSSMVAFENAPYTVHGSSVRRNSAVSFVLQLVSRRSASVSSRARRCPISNSLMASLAARAATSRSPKPNPKLCTTARCSSPRASGINSKASTLVAPADSPIAVTLPGSPPNAAALRCTQCSAASTSRLPKLAVAAPGNANQPKGPSR